MSQQELKAKLKRLYRPERYELHMMGQVMKRGDGKGLWLPGLYHKKADPQKKYIVDMELSLALDILNGYVKPQKKFLTPNSRKVFDGWQKGN